MRYELGVIGGGNMAEAILRGAVDAGVLDPAAVVVCEPVAERCEVFEAMGIATAADNAPAIDQASRVLLAVKPQVFADVADDLARLDPQAQMVISIMAGIRSDRIAAAMGQASRLRGPVVRVMPNTPLLAGVGMSAIARGAAARDDDVAWVERLLSAAGRTVVVDESLMDAVTAVSGSGPAYVFYLAEAMIQAGRSLGLSDRQAAELTQQTVLGAATLMQQSSDGPGELRRKVTSPGGTTQAALEHLEQHAFAKLIGDAIAQAATRSRELSE